MCVHVLCACECVECVRVYACVECVFVCVYACECGVTIKLLY